MRTPIVRLVAMASLVLGVVLPAAALDPLMIADFDVPPPNNLGGAYGAFTPDTTELMCITTETRDNGSKVGEEGSSLRLDYNVDKAGSLNGFWMKLGPQKEGNNFDASPYMSVSLWIRGESSVGIPTALIVELKGDPGTRIGRQYVRGIGREWTKVSLPLELYGDQGVDLTVLNELVVVFDNRQAAPATEGRIWIDNVMFE